MKNITYSCPLCKEDLEISQNGKKIQFFCLSCGYKRNGPSGYSTQKAYNYLTNTKKNRKSNFSSTGFTTKKSRRKSRVQLKEQEEEILEEDPIIQENVNKIRSMALERKLSKPLDRVVTNPELLPVYFNKLPKLEPPLGGSLDDLFTIPALQDQLKKKGINQLYEFQEETFNHIMDQKNVIISAPTGMGKTEAFLLPVLYRILMEEANPHLRSKPSALIVYPTKALATDQFDKIQYYARAVGITVGKYDGDTSQEDRQKLYQNKPDIILTNADMIHYHLMGNLQFQLMMKQIKFLVIDEIHLCVGSFGSNVLWIIRRLRRFASDLQCIGASATISNARNFGELIFGGDIKLVSAGTARRSEMNLTLLYPKTRSNLSLMADITKYFVDNNKKTLVFGNGHKSAEVVNMILEEKGVNSGIHRAGLSFKHRNRVESDFKSDKLDALVSTPTLELGIDIGSLDSVVSMLTGLTSFLQRIGRAGRQGQESFATLVLRGDDPISAYYARNPEEYLTDIDPAFVEPNNSFVSKFQLLAMTLDKPLSLDEAKNYKELTKKLLHEGLIIQNGDTIRIKDPPKVRKMLYDYSIRGIGNSVEIRYMNKKLGERSLPMALSELHENAIYLSGGNSYDVIKYDPELKLAKVKTSPERHIKTQALRNIHPKVNQVFFETEINGLNAAYCELQLTEEVHGYTKSQIFNNKTIGKYDLDEPINYSYETMGFLIALPHPTDEIEHLDKNEREEYLGGTFHAIEHVMIESGNAFSGGGSSQIGGISMGDSGLVFVYDGTEGGSGLSKLLFDSLEKGLKRTMKIMEDCPCKRVDGCPRCTYSYQCGNNNQPLNRIGGIEALRRFGKDNTELYYNFDGLESFVIEPEWDVNWTIQNWLDGLNNY